MKKGGIHIWPHDIDQQELSGPFPDIEESQQQAVAPENVSESAPPPATPDELAFEGVTPLLIDDALDLMKDAVRGNGLKPDAVRFDAFHGLVLHFEAYGIFKLQPQISQKDVPGKENGEVLGSRQEARNRVQATLQQAGVDPDIRKHTIHVLKKRADLGFATEYFGILHAQAGMHSVVHEVCTLCHGKKTWPCKQCNGLGKTVCKKCAGSKMMTCPTCRGALSVTGGKRQALKQPHAAAHAHEHAAHQAKIARGRKQKCPRCSGRGKVPCDGCRQTGSVPCLTCKAKGRTPCKNCAATGWHSHVTHLELRAKNRFEYNRALLPPELVALIDTLKGRLLTEGHADIRINENKSRDKELNNIGQSVNHEFLARKPDEYIIQYDVRVPWGDILFLLGKRTEAVAGKLFGFQPSLVHMAPFLEELTLPGQRALGEAAQGHKHVAGKVHDALRYRLLADTVMAATRLPPARAREVLLQRYPFGIGIETIETLLKQAKQALSHVTGRPRLGGLGLGLIVAAALDGAFLFGPGQSLLHPLAAGRNGIEVAGMGVVIVAGGAAATFGAKFAARRAMHEAIGRAPPAASEQGRKLMPRAEQSALWGYLGSVMLFAGLLGAAMLRGGPHPAWIEPLLRKIGL